MESSSSGDAVTIEDLNAEEARLYMGGTVLVCILSVTGIIGNLHVLLVYIFHMKQSNHRVFIICLAVLDIITCTIGMPFVIFNFQTPFMFHNTTICKILTFYNFFICISSAGVLIVIAVDRYRKICVPMGKQMSQKVAKAMCLVAMGISLLLSWPALVLYGSTPIATRIPTIMGHECNVLADVKETYYPIYFNAALLIVSVSCFIVLAVLYSIIGKVIWNHRSFQSKAETNSTEVTEVKMMDTAPCFKGDVNFHSGSSDCYDSSTRDDKDEDIKTVSTLAEQKEIVLESPRRRASSAGTKSTETRKSLQRAKSKFDRTKRTTIMLLWITIIFFFSYVPYLVLRIASYMIPDWYPSMSYAGKVTFNTILWFVYVNNMANCIIYGFCDQRFRQEVKNGYNRLCCRH